MCWLAFRAIHVKSTEAHTSEEVRCAEFSTEPGDPRVELSGRGRSFGSDSQHCKRMKAWIGVAWRCTHAELAFWGNLLRTPNI